MDRWGEEEGVAGAVVSTEVDLERTLRILAELGMKAASAGLNGAADGVTRGRHMPASTAVGPGSGDGVEGSAAASVGPGVEDGRPASRPGTGEPRLRVARRPGDLTLA